MAVPRTVGRIPRLRLRPAEPMVISDHSGFESEPMVAQFHPRTIRISPDGIRSCTYSPSVARTSGPTPAARTPSSANVDGICQETPRCLAETLGTGSNYSNSIVAMVLEPPKKSLTVNTHARVLLKRPHVHGPTRECGPGECAIPWGVMISHP